MNSVFAILMPNPGLPMDLQAGLGSILLPEFGAPDYPVVTHPNFYGGRFGTFAECHLETILSYPYGGRQPQIVITAGSMLPLLSYLCLLMVFFYIGMESILGTRRFMRI